MASVIECEIKSLSELYHMGHFQIPWHQRKYDWSGDDVSQLLYDIKDAIHTKQEFYFLGTIMLLTDTTNNGSKAKYFEVNDGQQRLITFSLICARLGQLYRERSREEEWALRILFADIDRHSDKTLEDADELDPRLILSQGDQDHFKRLIKGKSIDENSKLIEAWNEIMNFFNNEENAQMMDDYTLFIFQKIEIACLYIPNRIDPSLIFETLNARGKELEQFDLIRNHIYSYFNSRDDHQRRKEVHSRLETLRSSIAEHDWERYQLCYFQYQYGHLSKGRLYREIRIKILETTKEWGHDEKVDHIYRLSENLTTKKHIDLFYLINDPSSRSEIMTGFLRDSGTGRKVRNLYAFLSELCHYNVSWPVVFALLSQYVHAPPHKKEEVAKYVHKSISNLASFIMRTSFLVQRFQASRFETRFANLANQIKENHHDVDIFHILKEYDASHDYRAVDQKKFVDELKKIEWRFRSPKIKIFLVGINAQTRGDMKLLHDDACNIEHILPKSDKYWDDWQEKFKDENEECSDWVHRIGNLTLIEDAYNTSGDTNKNFNNKANRFKRSSVHITRDIVNDWNTWSPTSISKRQKEMAEKAADVWKFIE